MYAEEIFTGIGSPLYLINSYFLNSSICRNGFISQNCDDHILLRFRKLNITSSSSSAAFVFFFVPSGETRYADQFYILVMTTPLERFQLEVRTLFLD
jgi:hypothetical protein